MGSREHGAFVISNYNSIKLKLMRWNTPYDAYRALLSMLISHFRNEMILAGSIPDPETECIAVSTDWNQEHPSERELKCLNKTIGLFMVNCNELKNTPDVNLGTVNITQLNDFIGWSINSKRLLEGAAGILADRIFTGIELPASPLDKILEKTS